LFLAGGFVALSFLGLVLCRWLVLGKSESVKSH
jgi:hypothetical protein